ncbi:hypothetical protein RISK_001281 [Rhodopirellula islandica]|uniref:Uncharacterized protein n=1 Tax=Rhodopirellula islandica TaxID=595434 RepID=A0A0J1BJM3_RHOIS|nr:hypothetical protein RISK_001281 [Rhodopirellula islandica]
MRTERFQPEDAVETHGRDLSARFTQANIASYHDSESIQSKTIHE